MNRRKLLQSLAAIVTGSGALVVGRQAPPIPSDVTTQHPHGFALHAVQCSRCGANLLHPPLEFDNGEITPDCLAGMLAPQNVECGLCLQPLTVTFGEWR